MLFRQYTQSRRIVVFHLHENFKLCHPSAKSGIKTRNGSATGDSDEAFGQSRPCPKTGEFAPILCSAGYPNQTPQTGSGSLY